MPKTVIRPAVKNDFNTLLEIDAASFPEGIAYDSRELAYFMKRRGAETLVAEMDGEIVAFLLVEISAILGSAILVTLDVREDHRRRRIASTLLAKSEELLRERQTSRYELQVDVSNHAAMEFYGRHGFEKERIIKSYYSNGHDAYLMAKKL